MLRRIFFFSSQGINELTARNTAYQSIYLVKWFRSISRQWETFDSKGLPFYRKEMRREADRRIIQLWVYIINSPWMEVAYIIKYPNSKSLQAGNILLSSR